MAIASVALANFMADALMSMESGNSITDPGRDDRVKAVTQYFTQLLEATINNRRGKRLMERATVHVEGHA